MLIQERPVETEGLLMLILRATVMEIMVIMETETMEMEMETIEALTQEILRGFYTMFR